MRKIALVTAAVLATMAFASVSSASALSWTPQNTKTTIKGGSDLKFVTETGYVSDCSKPAVPQWSAIATGANLKWSGAGLSCYGGLVGNESVSILFKGEWSETATSTSTVTLNSSTGSPGNPVLWIEFQGAGRIWRCETEAIGPISSTGATWSNTTHKLTLNNSFPVKNHWNEPLCGEIVGKQVWLKGTLIHESNVSILP